MPAENQAHSQEIIIETKLDPPQLRADLVSRTRLTSKLDRILIYRLGLVIAPAGFGKTTLLRQWTAVSRLRVGWLSLDQRDNDPTRFLHYLLRAFHGAEETLGGDLLAPLETRHPPQLETILTQLVNRLAGVPHHLVLILDDYHVIDDPDVHEVVRFLIQHLPPRVHLLLASRAELALDLARLRAQSGLLELRSADLRFTAVEIDSFLNDVMKLDMSSSDQSSLDLRTEGWVAGLQLAALSLGGHEDKAAFISTFRGDHRHIADYLFEEVFKGQPDHIQDLMLRSSIADRLCGDLCLALTGRQDSQFLLETIEKANLFILPLDDQRRWYRFHPLFADLLRHQLGRAQPEAIPALHLRASQWFEAAGMLDDAVNHALAARSFERAASLIEHGLGRRDWIGPGMIGLAKQVQALPEDALHARPPLMLAYAWLLLEIYDDPWDDIEAYLRRVEALLASAAAGDRGFDAPDVQLMLAEVDLLRANHARHLGDTHRVIALCQAALARLPRPSALARLPQAETYIRGGTTAHLASAYESLGDLARAEEIYQHSIRLCRASHNVDGELFASARLMRVLCSRGDLRAAFRVYQGVLGHAEQRAGPDMGLVYVRMGDVFREWNQLEEAKTLARRGINLCRPFDAWRAGVVEGGVTLARVLAAQGDLEGALRALDETEGHRLGDLTHPLATRPDAVRARLYLGRDNYPAAANWAVRSGLSASDEPHHARELLRAREFDYLTLVRVYITQAVLAARGVRPPVVSPDPLADAALLLERLGQAALADGRYGIAIEVRLLQAITHYAGGEISPALEQLAAALEQAEPAGYVRLFLDEGDPVRELLSILAAQPLPPVSGDYVSDLLAGFPEATQAAQALRLPLGERLTPRENETLRLLASERSIEEIAAAMGVTTGTIYTYTKRIYGKLDVHSRAEAVYRAKTLQLL